MSGERREGDSLKGRTSTSVFGMEWSDVVVDWVSVSSGTVAMAEEGGWGGEGGRGGKGKGEGVIKGREGVEGASNRFSRLPARVLCWSGVSIW